MFSKLWTPWFECLDLARYRRGGLNSAEVGGEGVDHRNLELRGLSKGNKYSDLTVVKTMRRKPFNCVKRAQQRGLKVVNTRDKQPMKPNSLFKN